MADTTTTAYGLTKPEVGASEDTWGEKINTDLDTLDSVVNAIGGKTAAGTLSYADSAKLATTATGVDVTGNVAVSGTVDGVDIAARDAILTSTTTTANAALPKAGGAVTGDVSFGDNDKAIFGGATSELQIYSDGSDSYINDSGVGDLKLGGNQLQLNNAAQTANYIYAVDGAQVELKYNNALKLATTSTGVDITGTLTSDGLTVAGNVSVDGGTIKLDGNYPVGTNNVALGNTALDAVGSGGDGNTAIGSLALTDSTTGDNNTAIGYAALYDNSTASANTAVGASALEKTTTGADNSAVGFAALLNNTTGSYNSALGRQALRSNTTASNNTAVGYQAAYQTTTGTQNVVMGRGAMHSNSTGSYNVGLGYEALVNNTTASYNTALGYKAGYNNTTAADSLYVGALAGYLSTGANNTMVGMTAGQNSTSGDNNTYVGRGAGYSMSTGSKNTILGRYNGNQGGLDIRTSSNNIVLSDGDGNPRLRVTNEGQLLQLGTNHGGGYSAAFSNSATAGFGVSSYANSNGTTYRLYTGAGSGGNCFYVFTNGNVQNTNNSYGAISDVKLKENIIDSGSQWDDIKAVRVRKYSLISDNLDAPNQLGVVAQELEASGMDGLVYETPDQDNEMNDLGTVTKAVNYSILYMKAVKALQEAMDRIETLEAKVTALEAN